jgi:hypothetical protein
MPTPRSLFLLSILTLFAGFSMTVGGWKWAVPVSAIGSIGVLWFHFSAHFGKNGTRMKAWPQHLLIVSFIIANLLRGLDVGFATVMFIVVFAALLANVYVSGSAMMSESTDEDNAQTG